MTKLKMNIKKLSAVFFTMVVIVTAMVVSGCGSTVIDIKEARLLKVELEGFDGKGTAVLSVNQSKLKALKKEYRNKDNYDDIKEILDEISFEMEDPEANGTLSNGDKFKVIARYDKELAEEVGVVLENTTIECSVGDKLSEGVVIDAFKGVKIEYFGDNGEAYAYINAEDCDDIVEDQYIYFDFEGDYDNLKNGDKLIVRAESLNDLEENGYCLKEETKEFTVEGLTGTRTTLVGVAFNDLADEMHDEVEYYLEDDFDIASLNYTFDSGKKRDLDAFDFKYTPKVELLKYAYAYDEDDEKENTLIAYYRVTTEIECVEDQYGYENDDKLMKKGDKDKGVSYVAIKSSSFMVKADNTLDDEYVIFSIVSAINEEKCNKELDVDDYKFEYFDNNYKKLDSTTTEPAIEKTTENATEKADETATEATTEKATTKKEN